MDIRAAHWQLEELVFRTYMGAHVPFHYDNSDKFVSIVAFFFMIAVDTAEFTARRILLSFFMGLMAKLQWATLVDCTINLNYQEAPLGCGCGSHDLLLRQRHDAALCPQELRK
jgi:hypothetical protein